jgi:hypothetical protein
VVFFNTLPATTAIPALPTPQFGVDEVGVHRKPGRKPSHNGNAPRPVRFTSSMKRQLCHTRMLRGQVPPGGHRRTAALSARFPQAAPGPFAKGGRRSRSRHASSGFRLPPQREARRDAPPVRSAGSRVRGAGYGMSGCDVSAYL